MFLSKIQKYLLDDDRPMLSFWIISLILYPVFIVIYSEFRENIFVGILFRAFVISNIIFLDMAFLCILKRIFKRKAFFERGAVLHRLVYIILLILNLVISVYVLSMWYVRLRELDIL